MIYNDNISKLTVIARAVISIIVDTLKFAFRNWSQYVCSLDFANYYDFRRKIKNLFSRRFPRSDRQLIEDYYLGSWVNFFGFIRNFTMTSSICHTAIFFLDIIYEKFIDSALSVQISGQGSTELKSLEWL